MEVAASDVLRVRAISPWEFTSASRSPRSLASTSLTAGVAFGVLRGAAWATWRVRKLLRALALAMMRASASASSASGGRYGVLAAAAAAAERWSGGAMEATCEKRWRWDPGAALSPRAVFLAPRAWMLATSFALDAAVASAARALARGGGGGGRGGGGALEEEEE